jgi:hypothetical protein
MIWWLEHAQRFQEERRDITELEQGAEWLRGVAWRIEKGARFEVDFEVVHGDEVFALTLQYPDLFPKTPPSVLVRSEQTVSSHQWGAGGELCLEYRPENWEEHVTGAMMMQSAHRLIADERPAEGRGIVPSAHNITLGQSLRSVNCRFLMRQALRDYFSDKTVGTAFRAVITERYTHKTFVAIVNSLAGADEGDTWSDVDVPAAEWPYKRNAWLVHVADLPAIPLFDDVADFHRWLVEAGFTDVAEGLISDEALNAIILTDKSQSRFTWLTTPLNKRDLIRYTVITEEADHRRRPESHDALKGKKVGLIGCGSLGSKIAVSLARAGVGAIHLVDDDILMPGNLERHALDWRTVGQHKSAALKARINEIEPVCIVTTQQVGLGKQEAAGTIASLLDRLGNCDLIIDATASAIAFNYCAGTSQANRKPMVWAEVFAGGIGGYIARSRPDLEPPAAAARRQILAWCEAQGVPWTGAARDYGVEEGNQPALIADDADVSVIAAHTTRLAIDTLGAVADSAFPYPVYMIGLSDQWLFSQPFDTKPVSLTVEAWSSVAPVDAEAAKEAVEFAVSLLPKDEEPNAASSAA